MKSGVRERDIQNAVVSLLRWKGWMVREISQPRLVTGDLIGVPDVIAFKRGCTLLVECKRPGGKLRKSQHRFIDEIEEHRDTTLCYLIANDVENFTSALEYIEMMREQNEK